MAETHGAPIPSALNRFDNLLWLIKETQDRFGCLPEKQLADISESLGVTKSDVYGVATFYSFLSVQEQGRHVIRICKSLPCFIKKSQHIVNAIEDVTGCSLGKLTANARFSIKLTNCIGECDKAPVMMVDGRVYADLTPGKISQILKEYH
jgi:NADH:ubiquinone oxidoreductase subunit E